MDTSTGSATTIAACPTCGSQVGERDVFCSKCGVFLKNENGGRDKKREARPQTGAQSDYSFVHLMGEITQLQRDLLRQFRQGQAVQARQFEKALQAQSTNLDKALSHAAAQIEASEQRLSAWQRWAAALGAAVIVLLVIASQIV